MSNIADIKKIYIVGIGGVGLSALAQLLHEQGNAVSGSDRGDSPTTELLRSKGITVFIGHEAGNMPADTELLIYSDAVYEENPERMLAKERSIPQRSYFEALGDITKNYKVIAVAGAHGKTSTTAMLIDVLEEAGLDPTAIVGSLRAKTKSNFRSGQGEWFVVEADEYRRHFLNFTPQILVITNIDADHLDYYKDLADIQDAFRELAEKVPKDGYIIADAKDPRVAPVLQGLPCNVVDYRTHYDPQLPLKALSLHRINAAAVMAVAHVLAVGEEAALQALKSFTGTWRRFEYKGTMASGALVYDDYAHHPLEISTTLRSVREQFPDKKIIVAFHPHLYSRTKILLDDFASAFADAGEVLLAPIFAAREQPDPSITSEILAQRITQRGTKARAFESLEEVKKHLRSNAKEGDLVLTMGAGDIYKVGEALIETK